MYREHDKVYHRSKRQRDRELHEVIATECDAMENVLLQHARECYTHKNTYHETNIRYYRYLVKIADLFSGSKVFLNKPALHPHEAWCICTAKTEQFSTSYASPQFLKLMKINEVIVLGGVSSFHFGDATLHEKVTST